MTCIKLKSENSLETNLSLEKRKAYLEKKLTVFIIVPNKTNPLHIEMHHIHIEARRDEVLMNQVVGDKGLWVVRQKFCPTLEEAIAFAKNEWNVPDSISSSSTATSTATDSLSDESSLIINSNHITSNNPNPSIDQHVGLLGKGDNAPWIEKYNTNQEEDHNHHQASLSLSLYCVVKPGRGVASDDVYFCKNAFEQIHQTPVFGCPLGSKHESVVRVSFISRMNK